jgi:hypothetical protein
MVMPQKKKGHVDVLPKSPRHSRVEYSYEVIKTLEEARELPDVYAILEGDYGGQTYVTVPAKLVRCDEHALRYLLRDLDELEWNHTDGQRLSYQKQQVGDHFGGGMGGAEATGDVWVHKELRELGVEDRIRRVILGETPRLGLSEEEVDRIKEAQRIRIQEVMSRFKREDGSAK